MTSKPTASASFLIEAPKKVAEPVKAEAEQQLSFGDKKVSEIKIFGSFAEEEEQKGGFSIGAPKKSSTDLVADVKTQQSSFFSGLAAPNLDKSKTFVADLFGAKSEPKSLLGDKGISEAKSALPKKPEERDDPKSLQVFPLVK